MPSLVIVPSAVWLQRVFHSKSTLWVVPVTFYGTQCCCFPLKINIFGSSPHYYGSQCCLTTKCTLLKINILDGSLHLLWFPVFFSFEVLSAQNEHFGWFLSHFMVPSVVGLQHCFPLKIVILGDSLHFLWFPVLFGSNVFSAQNQYFGWFSSLFMVLCVVSFLVLFGFNSYVFHSKVNIFGGSLHFYGFQCCLTPKYSLLMNC